LRLKLSDANFQNPTFKRADYFYQHINGACHEKFASEISGFEWVGGSSDCPPASVGDLIGPHGPIEVRGSLYYDSNLTIRNSDVNKGIVQREWILVTGDPNDILTLQGWFDPRLMENEIPFRRAALAHQTKYPNEKRGWIIAQEDLSKDWSGLF